MRSYVIATGVSRFNCEPFRGRYLNLLCDRNIRIGFLLAGTGMRAPVLPLGAVAVAVGCRRNIVTINVKRCHHSPYGGYSQKLWITVWIKWEHVALYALGVG